MTEPVKCVCGGKPRVWSAEIEEDIWFSYVCECGIRSEYMPLLAEAKVVWRLMIHALKRHDALVAALAEIKALTVNWRDMLQFSTMKNLHEIASKAIEEE